MADGADTRGIPAVYFDFDGVLVDSEPIHFASWNLALKPLEVELGWDEYRRDCIGISDEALAFWLSARLQGRVRADAILSRLPHKQQYFARRMMAKPPMPLELPGLLTELAGICPLALVTSSARSEVEPVLVSTGVRERFAACVYGDEIEGHKPLPDPYLLAQSRIGAPGGLAVEDSSAGAKSARLAGLEVLMVAHPGEVATRVWLRLGLG